MSHYNEIYEDDQWRVFVWGGFILKEGNKLLYTGVTHKSCNEYAWSTSNYKCGSCGASIPQHIMDMVSFLFLTNPGPGLEWEVPREFKP